MEDATHLTLTPDEYNAVEHGPITAETEGGETVVVEIRTHLERFIDAFEDASSDEFFGKMAADVYETEEHSQNAPDNAVVLELADDRCRLPPHLITSLDDEGFPIVAVAKERIVFGVEE